MPFQVDSASPVPIYEQIADQLVISNKQIHQSQILLWKQISRLRHLQHQ